MAVILNKTKQMKADLHKEHVDNATKECVKIYTNKIPINTKKAIYDKYHTFIHLNYGMWSILEAQVSS